MCGPRVRLVVHVPNTDLRIRAASGKPQRFIELHPVVGEFVGPAYLPAARTFLIRHQPVAVPVRRNLLRSAVLRLLHLPPVRKEGALVLLVIEHIDLDVFLGLRNGQRTCGIHVLLHPLPVFVAFVSASAPPTSVWTSSHSGNAHAHSAASASSAVPSPRLLHFLPRVIAFIAIELPSSQDRGPRLHWGTLFLRPRIPRRWRLWLCRRQGPRRRLRSRARRPPRHSKSERACGHEKS